MNKTLEPLAPAIRTGEGILVYATNVVLALAAILPHGTTWAQSGLYLAILNSAHLIATKQEKIAAINAGLGIGGAPDKINPIDPSVLAGLVEDVKDIAEPAKEVVATDTPTAGGDGVAAGEQPVLPGEKLESAVTPDAPASEEAPAAEAPTQVTPPAGV